MNESSARGVAAINERKDQNLEVNAGYAAGELAKALARMQVGGTEIERNRAAGKIRKWTNVLRGMADGLLNVGSREPVSNTPAWVTLEVAHAGFATGAFLAAGQISDFENSRLKSLGAEQAVSPRLALNLSYLTEHGLSELSEMLDSRCYRVDVPEEATLLVVAHLATVGRQDEAHNLLDEIEPWMDRLRFYPVPTDVPTQDTHTDTVHLESVGEVVDRLRGIEDASRILMQNETLNIWIPLHDEFVELVWESCDPNDDEDSNDAGQPFAQCDARWRERAAMLLARYAELRRVHHLCSKPERRGENLFELRRLVRNRLEAEPGSVSSESDLRRAREVLRRDMTKRGRLGSEQRHHLRTAQSRDGRLPTRRQYVSIASRRLAGFNRDSGLENPDAVLSINMSEIEWSMLHGDAAINNAAELAFPPTISAKVSRCLQGSVAELVKRGVVTSGDVLAKLVPQIAGRQLATQFDDQRLRGLFSLTYRSFRTRRSLLLLHLQKQVQFEELPWVAAMLRQSTSTDDAAQVAFRTLVEVATLNLTAFPHAIVPNKLLQELRALAGAAQLDLNFLDELAADIFMGQFSRKFGHAARVADRQLAGTLYSAYYQLDNEALTRLPGGTSHIAEGLGELCAKRAGVTLGSWSAANNGCIIEQQQILTTQNLATLFEVGEVRDRLGPQVDSMARSSFEWLIAKLPMPYPDRHSRLISIKNAAYAWRQMIFYLSHSTDTAIESFLYWAETRLGEQSDEFRVRFLPALSGLRNAIDGRPVETNGGQVLLGWSTGTHWLMR